MFTRNGCKLYRKGLATFHCTILVKQSSMLSLTMHVFEFSHARCSGFATRPRSFFHRRLAELNKGGRGDRPPPGVQNFRAPGLARRTCKACRCTRPPSPESTSGSRAARPRSRGPALASRPCCRRSRRRASPESQGQTHSRARVPSLGFPARVGRALPGYRAAPSFGSQVPSVSPLREPPRPLWRAGPRWTGRPLAIPSPIRRQGLSVSGARS